VSGISRSIDKESAWQERHERQGFRGWQRIFANPFLNIWVTALGLGIIFFTFLSLVQYSTEALPGVDGYYHIRISSLMRSQGLKPAFPWLPLTILNPREFYDHHFLYHVALIPFTLTDLITGAKLSAVIFPTLTFLAIWWLLRNQRVAYSTIWSLGLLAISEAFIYRMSLVRAQSLSLGVMALGLHWLLTQKYKLLVPLAFIYVWLYDAFPILLVFAVIYTAALWLIERRLEWRPILYTGLGIALGLIFNPYFPNDIIFVIRHLLPKLTETTAVDVGSEWYPYRTSQLLENSPLALVAVFAGGLALGLRDRRMDTRTATSILILGLFTLMLFQSRRFIEYFPPFALIFAAFAFSPLLAKETTSSPETGNRTAPPVSASDAIRPSNRQAWIHIAILLLFLIPGSIFTMRKAQGSIRTTRPLGQFAGAAQWLEDNTPMEARVFQTDWDDFPQLFFHNTHNTYLVGLDPTYMQLYNKELYELWVDVTQGDVENPSEVIYKRFGAEYVVSDLNHRNFIEKAEQDPGLQEVFRDDHAIVYVLRSD